jgi:toxin ParE1/3/4
MAAHRIIVWDRAETDMIVAALTYDDIKPGLGSEFLIEAKAAIARAAGNPFQYPCFRRKPEVRRVLTKRFPYRVFFTRGNGEITVFRVVHAARHDREWKSNIPKY